MKASPYRVNLSEGDACYLSVDKTGNRKPDGNGIWQSPAGNKGLLYYIKSASQHDTLPVVPKMKE